MDCIKIWDLEVFAYHGVLKEEKLLGKFLIQLYMDVSEAQKKYMENQLTMPMYVRN